MKTPQRVDRPSFRRFDDYFCDDQIIRVLCRMRVGEARRLNERLFLQRIKPDEKMNGRSAAAEALEGLFPPRRAWRKYRPRNRERLSGTDSNFAALHLTIRALRNSEPPPDWAVRLNALIRAVQAKALRESPALLSPPEVILALKDEKKPNVRRPICSFPMVERVVISLTARYLREHLDHSFDRCSLAFRCRRGRRPAPKHHDAVQQILKYRKACGGKKLYVAECDIQGFFDAVDHQLARQSLDEVAKRASRSKRISGIAPRSLQLFDAYLDCFTFPRNILRIALPEAQKTKPEWSVKWPQEALREFHDLPRMAAVGVPQGGALSALISNTLLDRADRVLKQLRAKFNFHYVRYCDDMVIISPSKRACQKAFDAYLDTLHALKLPVHAPKESPPYARDHWDGKSRSVYRWGLREDKGEIPWIQFVGYQIRRDGLIRIRKTSFDKHIQKVVDAVEEVLDHVDPEGSANPKHVVRKTGAQIAHRLRMRLICMAVGSPKLWEPVNGPLPQTWCSGFSCLHRQPFLTRQLKALDRHRERQYRRVKRCLAKIPLPEADLVEEKRAKFHKYYGAPFSYFRQFTRRPLRPPSPV